MPELRPQLFSLSDLELHDIEEFARKNQLVNIQCLCAELRELRRLYAHLSLRLGMQAQQPSRPWPKIEVADAPPIP